VARASRAAKRARERVRGMSESPQATSESAGEGVAQSAPGCRKVASSARLLSHAYRIGWGGRGKVVPGNHSVVSVTQALPHTKLTCPHSPWSTHEHTRYYIKSAIPDCLFVSNTFMTFVKSYPAFIYLRSRKWGGSRPI